MASILLFEQLKTMKSDLEQLKAELTSVQKKYEENLAAYELKLEEVYNQSQEINQIQNEKEINLQNATKEWLDIKSRLEKSVMAPKQKIILNIGGDYSKRLLKL